MKCCCERGQGTKQLCLHDIHLPSSPSQCNCEDISDLENLGVQVSGGWWQLVFPQLRDKYALLNGYLDTVGTLITHTPRWTVQAMDFKGLWVQGVGKK